MWWMAGDLHDHEYPEASQWYPQHTVEAGHMMKFTIAFLAVYYLTIRPFKLLQPSREIEREYDDTGLTCRFKYIFRTWREYENIHILFWCGKDCAWNALDSPMWIICVVPTLLVAADFVVTTLFTKKMIVEHSHYLALFLWVIANLLWAAGELYDPRHDTPFALWDASPEARITCRWYSSWVLVSAYLSIALMYCIWVVYYWWNKEENERADSQCSIRNIKSSDMLTVLSRSNAVGVTQHPEVVSHSTRLLDDNKMPSLLQAQRVKSYGSSSNSAAVDVLPQDVESGLDDDVGCPL